MTSGVVAFRFGRTLVNYRLHSHGEMSEWLKEHAWKSTSAARADTHQLPPTQFRINDFRNLDVRRCVPVHRGVCRGFQGYVTQV
jgi:hypothetical protein